MEELSLKEIKQKTMKILKTDNLEDVAYITQDLIEQEYEEDQETTDDYLEQISKSAKVIYAHNMHYGWINGQHAYIYQRGPHPHKGIKNACGHLKLFKYFKDVEHYPTKYVCKEYGDFDHRVISMFVIKS